MSCRVFGRQLEFETMNIAVEQARHRGSKGFRADYIPTPEKRRNKCTVFEFGFSPAEW